MIQYAKLFTMLNNKNILSYLCSLGLSTDEAAVYLELLRGPRSHLELARATGINRTKVYRLADELEKRSLVTTRTDDSGTLLAAADPRTLEVELVTREETLKNQRAIFHHLLPTLEAIGSGDESVTNFSTQTYEGVEGFKQMLWHELKTENEILIFGSGTIENLVDSKRWAEKHRTMTIEANYSVREILNPGRKSKDFTKNAYFKSHHYQERFISPEILLLNQQVAVYNNTVATYCWRNAHKVGVEVTNASHATMMRQMFEHYWSVARDSPKDITMPAQQPHQTRL